MKTKIFTLFLALVASIGTMFAESGTCGANLTWSLNKSSGLLTISGTGPMTSFGSADDVPWYPYYNEAIKSVKISSGVTSIGDYAFFGCDNLTSVTIPNSVASIGEYAFYGCDGLTSVTIGNGVTSIGECAFYGCKVLTSVTIGSGVASIGESAFYNCRGLTSITIPNSVTSIGYDAFYGCEGLTSITIPNSVTSIGDGAFFGCEGLTSINVASDNTTYDSRNNCNAIIETSSNTLISGCMNTTIPNSVTSIGNLAFSECTGLTSIEIPTSVTSIGQYAFYDCKGLTSVTIPNSVTSIGQYAFSNCKGLTSVTIPNSVTSIGGSAFSGCTSLTSIEIPNSVTSIGYDAFKGCSKLTSVTIPNSVTSIGESAFHYCTGLTSITIPNSVTSIGNYAFGECTGLTSIEIPNSVTSIGNVAFSYCTGLTSVTIPNSVTSIGQSAFGSCKNLKAIICQATIPPSLGNDVFDKNDCSKIPLYVPVESINTYKSAKQWKDFTTILPIVAEDAETNTLKAEPTETTVAVTWPIVAGAYTYELVIRDKKGNVLCTLVFNAQGQLQSIIFAAPSRDGAPQKKQETGFAFTIIGLTEGTSYDVIITAKDSEGNTLDTKIVSFTTEGDAPTGIDDINAATKSQKILRDNQVLILRGEKTYTLTGQEVK
ncbi:MAG: leucine-rich repeat domain-containing protein [Paludibacteraceae bacterium]|nr:leucine-rich repeat domain-containing protein [Paludibacteraceae bacterium]